jgi:hypothetical protein
MRWGGGTFIPPHIEVTIRVSETQTSLASGLVQMESFSIQMVTGRLTRTSSDMSQTSPAKVESGSWLTWTSPDKGWTSPDNPGWDNLDDPDLFGWVRIGPD